ncbi:MAG: hypothetical protein LBE08_08525, partial [Bifidobacteriaceae bacterium]|nr:hypothetical protein [Bifidobacteriaceae bacterium]
MPPLSNDQGNFAHGSTSQPVAPAAVPGVPEFPLAEAYRPARESNSAPPAAPVLPRRRPLPTRQAPRVEDLPAPPRGYQNVPPPLAMPLPRTTPPRGLPALGPEASQRHSLGNVFPAASGVQNRVRPLPTRQAPRVEDLPAPPAGY